MMEQEQLHWLTQIDRWRLVPSEHAVKRSEDLLPLLQLIDRERERGDVAKERLDLAEATVLTMLAEERWHKTGGLSLVDEWIRKARHVDGAYIGAAELQCRFNLHLIQNELLIESPFPILRETDNSATRKKHVEDLRQGVEARIQKASRWQELLTTGLEAAQDASHEKYKSDYSQLIAFFVQREHLLQEIKERAEAYAESMQGVFYSTDLLADLQLTLRQLQTVEADIHEQTQMQKQDMPIASLGISAIEKVDDLVGLAEIKERVKQLYQFLQYHKIRSEKGWIMQDQPPLHLVLMGNPGTGKTTLARLMAKLYHELGLLVRDEVIEVDRSHLIGAFVGQTEQRTTEAIQRAVGGVLFIDEAYSLKRADSQGNDYGQVAIDTLVAAMTSGEYAGKFVVILAGYPEEMRNFLTANTGLRSRFPESGHYLLPDYTGEELLSIAKKVAERNDFTLLPATLQAIRQRIEQERVDESFGNARAVKNIVLDAIFAKGNKVNTEKELQLDDFTIIYPEDVFTSQNKSMEPSEQVEQLVGLEEIKAELRKITSFITIQDRRLEQGLPAVPIELHAVFTGNPGTGKTTVAKLYAQMLRDTGYLKRGHLVTVSRADLVASYVGQTASQTKRKIREALGGVLFIDEAYALFQASENDFGRESIHTLVDEMSKHQENLVVILAGYEQEMERLIQSNPGLSSRFKKYFFFPDYQVDELMQILQATIKSAGYTIEPQAKNYLAEKLTMMLEQGFLSGNARFVKNVVQEAMQEQAVRLSAVSEMKLTKDQLTLLMCADFEKIFA